MPKTANRRVAFDYSLPFGSTELGPFITLTFGDPLLHETLTQPVMVDTGFDGYLVIPENLFNKLKLFKYLIPNMNIVGEIANGSIINFASAKGRITISELKIDLKIDIDTFKECNAPLIGRSLLNEFYCELQGPDKKVILYNEN